MSLTGRDGSTPFSRMRKTPASRGFSVFSRAFRSTALDPSGASTILKMQIRGPTYGPRLVKQAGSPTRGRADRTASVEGRQRVDPTGALARQDRTRWSSPPQAGTDALTGCVVAQMPQGTVSRTGGLPRNLLQSARALARSLYRRLIPLKRLLNSFASLTCRHCPLLLTIRMIARNRRFTLFL